MAKDKITDSYKILSYEEESKLSLEEKRLYYSALKEYLLKSRLILVFFCSTKYSLYILLFWED